MTQRVDVSMLSANTWTIRATVEAQLRELTALQRCVEDFRESGTSDAYEGMVKHLTAIHRQHDDIGRDLPLARQEMEKIGEARQRDLSR